MLIQKSISLFFIRLFFAFFIVSTVYATEDSSRRNPVVKAVEKVAPAVVSIFIEGSSSIPINPFFGFQDNFFENFFSDLVPKRNSKRQSLGSGVIINSRGFVVTNAHVIEKATAIQMTLSDKRRVKAHLIGADVKSDLAILKIEFQEPLPYLNMGRSDDLMIGETVIAIGNPFGLQHTVTKGIISALHRTIRSKKNIYHDFIQVDASINPGNSGGPLINIKGNLIGINAAIYRQAEGIGFAIPIDHTKRIVNELIQFGKVRRGWLGVSVQDMTETLSQHFGLNRPRGVLVIKVFPESSGGRAGLRQGDIILSIDRHEVQNKTDFQQTISSYTLGHSLAVDVLKEGKRTRMKLKVAPISRIDAESFAKHWLGIKVDTISPNLRRHYRLMASKGVVITSVDPKGPCGEIGLSPGDVIRQINQVRVRGLEDFNQIITTAGSRSSLLLLVQRGRNGYYVTIEP